MSRDGSREIPGAAEGMKEDKESWRSFFAWLKKRGLSGVRLIIGDKSPGMLNRYLKYPRKPNINAAPFIFTGMFSQSHQESE